MDTDVVILRKKPPKASALKTEQAVNTARRQGAAIDTQQKYGAASNKQQLQPSTQRSLIEKLKS